MKDQLYECKKQHVVAILVSKDNQIFYGYNGCKVNVPECPRKNMESGKGYDKCISKCKQVGHAEAVVCNIAGKYAKGSKVYLFGHSYSCDDCKKHMKECGVVGYYICSNNENKYFEL